MRIEVQQAVQRSNLQRRRRRTIERDDDVSRYFLARSARRTLQRRGVLHINSNGAAERVLARRSLARHYDVRNTDRGRTREASDTIEADVRDRVVTGATAVPSPLRLLADEAAHSHVGSPVDTGAPDDIA